MGLALNQDAVPGKWRGQARKLLVEGGEVVPQLAHLLGSRGIGQLEGEEFGPVGCKYENDVFVVCAELEIFESNTESVGPCDRIEDDMIVIHGKFTLAAAAQQAVGVLHGKAVNLCPGPAPADARAVRLIHGSQYLVRDIVHQTGDLSAGGL